ncbi:hypothetical protein H0E84_15875 [Luteimonas sp. SJ-92]|uniref:Tetratricopeptide repeat protein n=2 Tax=Luteimonas salinisoli TaxID=2752307 RepID=A0A853JH21_9GAMM|nr:hypothetical protein [Luteimonas salinisoli]NZA27857.1 hypothetical protein [Luteimonas salinisoli]
MLLLILISTAVLVGVALAAEPGTPTIEQIRDRWAEISYQLPKAQRESAFEELARQVEGVRQARPRDAEALIWEGIVLSSLAGEKGGMGALGLVKRARADFEAALEIAPDALDGAAYTSLGALYYQVPGWPLGFGDDDTARTLLRQGLAIDPDGIDANYFYADFLRDQKDWRGAKEGFEKALAAPARSGRELADAGRRREAQSKLQEAARRLAD